MVCLREGPRDGSGRAERDRDREGDPEEDFQDAQDALEELAEQEEEEAELEEVCKSCSHLLLVVSNAVRRAQGTVWLSVFPLLGIFSKRCSELLPASAQPCKEQSSEIRSRTANCAGTVVSLWPAITHGSPKGSISHG